MVQGETPSEKGPNIVSQVDYSVTFNLTQYHEEFIIEPTINPYHIIVDPEHMVWVTEAEVSKLWRMDPVSGEIETIILDDGITPLILEIGSGNDLWFSSSDLKIGNKTNFIGRIDRNTLEVSTFQIPTLDASPFMMEYHENLLYFTEWTAGQIGILDPITGSVEEFQIPCDFACGPIGLEFDDEGNLWYAESIQNQFVKVDFEGLDFTVVDFPEGIFSPVTLRIDKQGILWSGSHGGDEIVSYNPKTDTFELFHSENPPRGQYPISGINDIEIAENGDIWFTEHFFSRIGKLDRQTRTITEYIIQREDPLVQWLTIDNQGNIWMAEYGNSRLIRLDPNNLPVINISLEDEFEISRKQKKSLDLEIEYLQGKSAFIGNLMASVRRLSLLEFTALDEIQIDVGETVKASIDVRIFLQAPEDTYNLVVGIINDNLAISSKINMIVSGESGNRIPVNTSLIFLGIFVVAVYRRFRQKL